MMTVCRRIRDAWSATFVLALSVARLAPVMVPIPPTAGHLRYLHTNSGGPRDAEVITSFLNIYDAPTGTKFTKYVP